MQTAIFFSSLQPMSVSQLFLGGLPPSAEKGGHKSQPFAALPPHCGSQHTTVPVLLIRVLATSIPVPVMNNNMWRIAFNILSADS